MTVPDPKNYWHERNKQRQRVRTQRGGSGWDSSRTTNRHTQTSGNGRGAVNTGRRPAGYRDPGPPPGRGRLEGTTHRIRRPRRRSLLQRLRPRRRRKFGRIKVGGPITMVWSGVTLLLGAAAYVFQGVAWLAWAGASLGVTTIVGIVEARTHRSAAPRPPRKAAKPANPSTSGGSSTGSGSGSGGGSKRRCSDGCKRSPKPKSTCRCKAPDCKHGSMAGAAP